MAYLHLCVVLLCCYTILVSISATVDNQELFNLIHQTHCTKRHPISRHCYPNTVQIDPWLQQTLLFQTQELYKNISLSRLPVIGTHNSFNTRSDGYGADDNLFYIILHDYFHLSENDSNFVIAQQEFSMTDQLNIGVRFLHLDVQYFRHQLVLCHAGTKVESFDKVIQWVEKTFNKTFEYSSYQLGCTKHDRLWKSGIQEINQWLVKHPQEVIFILINDDVGWDWNHIATLINDTVSILQDKVLTPPQKKKWFPRDDTWPTLYQMTQQLKKQVILVGNSDYTAQDQHDVFPPFFVTYPKNRAKLFTPYPQCGGYDYEKDWSCFSGESWSLGPFYNGPKDMGLITPTNLNDFVDCGIKFINLDQVSPPLIQSMIWHWNHSQPTHQNDFCVALSSTTLHWQSVDCNDTRIQFKVCQSQLVSREWKIVNRSLDCPMGMQWSTPTNPFYNRIIKDALQQQMQSKRSTETVFVLFSLQKKSNQWIYL